jgi:hypothetical protein
MEPANLNATATTRPVALSFQSVTTYSPTGFSETAPQGMETTIVAFATRFGRHRDSRPKTPIRWDSTKRVEQLLTNGTIAVTIPLWPFVWRALLIVSFYTCFLL